MADEIKMNAAKAVYETICKALDAREWTYDRHEEDMAISFGVNGEDLPMQFIFHVDAERELVRLFSGMPFNMAEDKRIDGAIATCAATYECIDGSFDYDVSNGKIIYRITQSYRSSKLGEAVFQYMISVACTTIDEYNDKFLAINKGYMSIEDFLKSLDE